jgi:hypothetical protein
MDLGGCAFLQSSGVAVQIDDGCQDAIALWLKQCSSAAVYRLAS